MYAQAKSTGHNAEGSKSTLDPRECDGGVYMCICLGLRLALLPRISLAMSLNTIFILHHKISSCAVMVLLTKTETIENGFGYLK